MKKNLLITLLLFLISYSLFSQNGIKEINKEDKFSVVEKTSGISDRAGGTHNASNIGLFFENRGKLYPRRLTQGPSGEYPINSGKHYIYRINPFIGVPDNVVQGRYTTDEEWEAVGGYHNKELALIAFSDNANSWDPNRGWPIKDAQGNPVIKSDQDSYCVYSDSNNSRPKLGLLVAQTGYAYGVNFAKNLLFFKFEITNKGVKDLDSLFFGLYCDIDVGNASGGAPEHADDMFGFNKEKNFVYFYDSKGYSTEWPDGKSGYFGVAFLKTPKINGVELGLTDMHYNIYDDDMDIDSIQYGILSSNRSLYTNPTWGPKYFHVGNNPNIHYDDLSTIPSTGLDLLANFGSGPYKLKIGDTLAFYTAIVAGDNLQDAMSTLDQAYRILNYDFEIAKPPASPTLSGVAEDKKVTLYWDNKAESSYDKFSGQYDFEGYRLYRSMDKGVTWDKLADYDAPNNIGLNSGIQYAYIDSTITNGFEYWYSITSFDRGDSSVPSLESPKGNTLSVKNILSLIPVSNALGRTPVSTNSKEHFGTGKSNYILNVRPIDKDALGNNEYKINFTYTYRMENGKLNTRASVTIADSTRTKPYRYGIFFKSNKAFDFVNLTTGDVIKENYNYRSGASYSIDGIKIKLDDPDPSAPAEFLPKAGDYISVNFSVQCVKNNVDTVLTPRTILFNKLLATSDGVIFSIDEILDNPVLPNLQDFYKFSIKPSSINKDEIIQNLNKIKVVPNPYVVSSLYEPEYGELRREPLRQLQFINLPNVCTIYIFSINADLVKTLHHNSLSGTETWDLKAEGKREIAPGIYIFVVDVNGTKYKGRFAVIK